MKPSRPCLPPFTFPRPAHPVFFFPLPKSHTCSPSPPLPLPLFLPPRLPTYLLLVLQSRVVHSGVSHPLYCIPTPTISLQRFCRQLRRSGFLIARIPFTLPIPSLTCAGTYRDYAIPIRQSSVRFYSPPHRLSYAPIMSSDDDMPLARTNGHCKCFALLLSSWRMPYVVGLV